MMVSNYGYEREPQSKRTKGSKHSHHASNGRSSANNNGTNSNNNSSATKGGPDAASAAAAAADAKNRAPNPGVYTCATCNALFTCLEYYQQHRRLHSESNGVKLLTCCHCPYSTDNQFHYNWHIMSHTGEPPHRCTVCDKSDEEEEGEEDEDNPLTPNGSPTVGGHGSVGLKLEDQLLSDEDLSSKSSGKRSVATATADDMLLINNSNSSSSAAFVDLIPPHLQNSPSSQRWPQDMNSHLLSSYASHPFYGVPMGTPTSVGSYAENGTATQVMSPHQTSFQSPYQSASNIVDEMGQSSSLEQLNSSGLINSSLNESSEDVPIGIPTTKGKGKGNRKSRIADNGQAFSEMRRKFHCSHCGKSFKTKSHLQRHILTHTGEKPYVCTKCGSKFNQSSSLRNHVIAIHTKDYPHFCEICQKGFLMPALLQRHLANSHHDGAGGGGGDGDIDEDEEELD